MAIREMNTMALVLTLALCCAAMMGQGAAASRVDTESKTCGIQNKPCCEGSVCEGEGLRCFFGECEKCGGKDQICCEGGLCGEDQATGEQLTCTPYENRCRACGTHEGSPCCDSELACNPKRSLSCKQTTVGGEATRLCTKCGGIGQECCPHPYDDKTMFGCEIGCSCVKIDAPGMEKTCVYNDDLVDAALGID